VGESGPENTVYGRGKSKKRKRKKLGKKVRNVRGVKSKNLIPYKFANY
jgi:hypothetical protein